MVVVVALTMMVVTIGYVTFPNYFLHKPNRRVRNMMSNRKCLFETLNRVIRPLISQMVARKMELLLNQILTSSLMITRHVEIANQWIYNTL